MRASCDATRVRDSYITDAQVLEAAAHMVDDCLPIIEWLSPGEDILDASLLPSPKQSLESGFRLSIATTMQDARRRRLVSVGKLLAQFQPGVGQRISFSPAPTLGTLRTSDRAFSEHVEQMLQRSREDRIRLTRLFAEADSFAQRRFAAAPTPPFQEDGTYCWYGHH
ncbi:hypothetical protein JNB91_27500 [Rhizobium wenxiniae]|uniref:hypothetical protein n=1 Tax=Rhizobium wenxiniae TaxID=1737357 RepID=UPI001C6E6651|nr:hypothetical protein [Rhizobium wenxiniae]MBW9091550.1 hypothetical protein [Rhizobium wenxiniae]